MWILLLVTVSESGSTYTHEIGSFKYEKQCEAARSALLESATKFGDSAGRKSYVCVSK